MSIEEKIKNAEATSWLTDGLTEEEVLRAKQMPVNPQNLPKTDSIKSNFYVGEAVVCTGSELFIGKITEIVSGGATVQILGDKYPLHISDRFMHHISDEAYKEISDAWFGQELMIHEY